MRIIHTKYSLIFKFVFILTLALCLNSLGFSQDETTDECKTTNKKAEKLFNQGVSQMKSGQYSEAFKLFKQSIEEDPDYADPYYAIGRIYLKKQASAGTSASNVNYLSSVKHYYKKVIELCPTYDVRCYYILGDIYLGDDNYDSAYYYMNEFIKDPDKIKNEAEFNHADSVVTYTKTLKTLTYNKVPFKPEFVKNISSPLDEYIPLISPDNEMAFFVRKTKLPKSKDVFYSQEDKYQEKFMYSELGKDGEFDAGTEMPLPFNTTENQGAATITIDNKYLYFVFCEYAKGSNYYNCDICSSEHKADGSWGDIVNLGAKVNGAKTWESQPTVSSDGKTLYFISDRSGGYGGYDIYKTTKDSAGNWTVPENLGPNINSAGNEKTPYLHTDNLTLYFSSTGWPGLGGYDIYYSRKGMDGKYGKPKNIGYPINTAADDVGFTVSTDGHYGYFASNKYTGPGGWDVYRFELYADARPDTVLLVKGNVKDVVSNEPTKAKVELKNVKTKQVMEIPVDSVTGKYVIATVFRNDYVLTVKKEDYAYTSKYISKEDTSITNASTKVNVDFDVKPIEVGEAYRLNDIHFAYGSYDLTEDSKLIIDGFIDFLNDHPTMKVSINGHTDNISGADFNQTLSENRAKSVYDYMVGKGISASRLAYKGYGLTKPIATNDTEAGRATNRRTEFVIIAK
jgi:outer membrane protein OmpA-like peptidoglycan-associated protein/tetratricopeptide (TPR) repeat protein